MTTATRAPQVWRGYDALALADGPIGSHYSPNALTALRLLARRPATVAEIGRVIGRKTCRARQTVARLLALELVVATGEHFELTEHGRGLVALIDQEGIA